MMIDYFILANSIEYYEGIGYTRIETPWAVSKAVSDITKPDAKGVYEIKHNDKVLVGSGEQGYLYLYLKNFLPKGKYQTITPCFRSDVFDFAHSKYFMKNELIITDQVHFGMVEKIVQDAFDFFSEYIPKEYLRKVATIEGFDIEYHSPHSTYELGSYGLRRCEFLEWVYGTGVAEPRFSRVVKLLNPNL